MNNCCQVLDQGNVDEQGPVKLIFLKNQKHSVRIIYSFRVHPNMSIMLGSELSQKALDQINGRESTVVVATVSENGYPNTTPVHLIIAPDPKRLLMAIYKDHQGTLNIQANGKVMVSLCEKDDLNISIRGDGLVVKEGLESSPSMRAVRIDIIDIKSDSTHSETISGIRYRSKTEKGDIFIKNSFDELWEISKN